MASNIDFVDALDVQVVYRRTPEGQRMLLVDDAQVLSRSERRLLGVVTGLTPFSVLLNMGFDYGELRRAAAELTRLGLVERTGD